jgi:ribonuclease Z
MNVTTIPSVLEVESLVDSLKIKSLYWQKKISIAESSWTICGFSRSADRTGFYIKELDIMLDAGPQNYNKPSHIFITHPHIDHVASLPLTMIDDSNNTKKHIFQVYCHYKAERFIDSYVKSMFYMNAMSTYVKVDNFYKYNGLKEGDRFRINMNKTDIEVQVFNCDHGIPTISYGFSEVKQKLKDEYVGLPGSEIGALKKQGVDITKEVIQKKLAYVCDTSIKVFEMNPNILDYRTVFIECTFFMSDEINNAIKNKHIHWDQLKPYITMHPEITFVLFHFSQRYKDVEISEFFQKEIDNGITNISWF